MEKMSDMLITNNILDLILPTERQLLENYLPYLRCSKCGDVMPEPRSCASCNQNLCPQCKTCQHELSQSRYINILLDTIYFTCRNHCGEQKIKYSELRGHMSKCKSSPMKEASSQAKQLGENIKSSSIPLRMSEGFMNHLKFQSVPQVKCLRCGKMFYNKEEYTAHYQTCQLSQEENKDPLLLTQVFIKNSQEILHRLRSYIGENIEQNRTSAIYHLIKLNKSLHEKQKMITNSRNKIQMLISGQSLNEDEELKQLIDQETNLLQKKNKATNEYEMKRNEMKIATEEKEKQINQELEDYRNHLTALETEERWAREILEGVILISNCQEKCSKCGNNDINTKKYICHTCREKFCLDKCIKQCKNLSCGKYLCLKDTVDCKLCRKVNYCEDCLKKCFYQGCTNKFCPECYKKNEHQTRVSNINCKFFTCENDQVCDCLMTSLFCAKCEKRLCNKCLMNDKEHWQFLKLE